MNFIEGVQPELVPVDEIGSELAAVADQPLPDEAKAAAPAAASIEQAGIFTTLMEQHQGELQHFVANIAGSVLAEDIVQNTFLSAFKAMDRFEDMGPAAARSWLYTIARNCALNTIRQDKKHAVVVRNDEVDPTGPEPALIANTASELANPVGEQLRREDLEALSRICPSQYRLLVLKIGGFSYEEMAKIEDIPLKAVSSRIVRGFQAARRILLETPDTEAEVETEAA